jgi:LAO/AO transport system kinase
VAGTQGGDDADADAAEAADAADEAAAHWTPRIVETVATEGEGVATLIDALDAHADHLRASGGLERKARSRYAEEIRQLVRADAAALLAEELDRHGGLDALAEAVCERETDPYTVADRVIDPLAECVRERRG